MRWPLARSLHGAGLDRAIERELIVGLSPGRRAVLHERLRNDPSARARYDRAVEALRVLEGDVDVAQSELDMVGRWLSDDRGVPRPAAAERRGWPAVLAMLAAALVLLWISPLRDHQALQPWTGDGWQARGDGRPEGLALEALCGPDEAEPDPAAVRVRDCSLADLLGLAYRVPDGTHGRLTVFGVDAEGDPMFYLPTPDDPSGPAVEPGRFRALHTAVRLRVNHAPGPLRIYGLVAPTVATTSEVEALARALAPLPPAEPGDPPWNARVAPSLLARLCQDDLLRGFPSPVPDANGCRAAELHLTLRPERRP